MNRKAALTRKLYAFETLLSKDCRHWAWRERSMGTLQRLTVRIWRELDVQRPMPRVVGGRGMLQNGAWVSYQQSYKDRRETSRIELARHHRRVAILLHELAHELGDDRGYVHGPAFIRRYVMLLIRYGRMKPEYLQSVAHGCPWDYAI